MAKEVIQFKTFVDFIQYMKTNRGTWISDDNPEKRVIGFEKNNLRIEIKIEIVIEEISKDVIDAETELFRSWEGRKQFGESCR